MGAVADVFPAPGRSAGPACTHAPCYAAVAFGVEPAAPRRNQGELATASARAPAAAKCAAAARRTLGAQLVSARLWCAHRRQEDAGECGLRCGIGLATNDREGLT